jgi:hypothetical protein
MYSDLILVVDGEYTTGDGSQTCIHKVTQKVLTVLSADVMYQLLNKVGVNSSKQVQQARQLLLTLHPRLVVIWVALLKMPKIFCTKVQR